MEGASACDFSSPCPCCLSPSSEPACHSLFPGCSRSNKGTIPTGGRSHTQPRGIRVCGDEPEDDSGTARVEPFDPRAYTVGAGSRSRRPESGRSRQPGLSGEPTGSPGTDFPLCLRAEPRLPPPPRRCSSWNQKQQGSSSALSFHSGKGPPRWTQAILFFF